MHHDFDTPIDRRGSDSLKWAKYAGRRSRHGEEIIPMWVADMDFAAPPAVLSALQQRIAHGVLGYSHSRPEFLQAITGAMARDYGWSIEPEWIVPLAGLVSGLNIASRSIGEKGDAIVTATPVYPALFTAPVNMERECVRIPLDENWGWDMDAVAAAHTPRTKGLMLCHPHNPVGRVWHEAELSGIAEYAEKNDLVVVSDEIHCDMMLEPGARHRPFALLSPQMARRTITLMAPSKTYNIPGLGADFAIIPDTPLRQRFQSAMAGIAPHLNVLGMVATTAAYAQCVDWRHGLLDYLRNNRDLVMTLDGVRGLRVIKPEATYLAWIDCRATSLENPQAFFEAAGVGLSAGEDFGREGFLRLNFGCTTATLQEALRRMRQALEEHAA
ncbi:MAG: PatB family C-S lyase [bacterium]|nr:PatB family C-S lyase [bacterium]